MRFSVTEQTGGLCIRFTQFMLVPDGTQLPVGNRLHAHAAQFLRDPQGVAACGEGERARARCVAVLAGRLFPCVAGVSRAIVHLDDQTAAVAFAWLARAMLLQNCPPHLQPQPSGYSGSSDWYWQIRTERLDVDVPPIEAWWPEEREPASPGLVQAATHWAAVWAHGSRVVTRPDPD